MLGIPLGSLMLVGPLGLNLFYTFIDNVPIGAAPNNLAATTLAFFQEAVGNFGFPLR